MDTLRQQLLRIQQQLNGLSASQKMLTASLVAIMVMTIIWWARYAGTAAMEPLLDQSMTAEEIARIKPLLSARGVNHTVTGDRILVPADRRNEMLAELSYEQLLPADMRSGFDEMVTRTSMFDSQARTDQFMNRAREITLSQIISRYPSVRTATVTIDASRQRRIGADLRPTAAVSVQMKPGYTPDSKLVDAIANQISGAIAGLSASNVSVIIDQRHYRTKDRENDPLAQGTDILEMMHAHERRLEEKIRSQYYYISGLAAGVTVQLDVGTRTQRSLKHDSIQQKEKTSETETEETTSGPAQSGEPGAVPNMGLEVPTGGGIAQNSTVRERTRSEFEMFPNTTEETLTTPAGTAKAVSASVRVPLSHFIAIWKRGNPNATAEPDDATLRPIIEQELAKIRLDVMKITGIAVESEIAVAEYIDSILPTELASGPGATASIGSMIGGNVPEIAVGALALVSLFMVSMMVRRAAPAPLPAPVPVVETPRTETISAGEAVAGEVGAGISALIGQELDDEQLESNQMIDQVSTMVKENPDAAAQLIKRWLNRS